MKKLYFDTPYLCRVYSREPGQAAVKGLLDQAESLTIAWHGRAEFAAVLLRKRRENSDPPEFLDSLDQQFQNDCQSGLIQILPLTDAVMRRLESTPRTAPCERSAKSPWIATFRNATNNSKTTQSGLGTRYRGLRGRLPGSTNQTTAKIHTTRGKGDPVGREETFL